MRSDALDVREFTEAAGTVCPKAPTVMSKSDAIFLTRMIISELDELLCTVSSGPEERDALLQSALDTRDRCKEFSYPSKDELVAAQFDALVDAWYYSLNVAARHGVNMSSIFNVVHTANMAKRDPVTGKFQKRADGKIVKPVGWTPPDITAEIQRQCTNGSWGRPRSPAAQDSP